MYLYLMYQLVHFVPASEVSDSEYELFAKFESRRAAMIEVGMAIGLTHPTTLRLSQEVDKFHNELMLRQQQASREESIWYDSNYTSNLMH